MEKSMVIWVDANFATSQNLFDELKKYAHSYDERHLYVDDFIFTTEILPQYDGVLILNSPSAYRKLLSYPNSVFAIMMEPGDPVEHPWMYRKLGQYHKVFSPVAFAPNMIPSQGFLGWYLKHDYKKLSQLAPPEKEKSISCIASNLTQLAGHRDRKLFVEYLKSNMPEIDFYGKGIRYIEHKDEGLLPYKYSIAIENTSSDFYFTEKINDCFLTYTIPIYYGCKNIGKYFPEKSFFYVDIMDRKKACKQIRNIVETHDWSLSLNALCEARDLVLNKYQPLIGIADEFRSAKKENTIRTEIELHPVTKSYSDRLKSKVRRFLTNT